LENQATQSAGVIAIVRVSQRCRECSSQRCRRAVKYLRLSLKDVPLVQLFGEKRAHPTSMVMRVLLSYVGTQCQRILVVIRQKRIQSKAMLVEICQTLHLARFRFDGHQ